MLSGLNASDNALNSRVDSEQDARVAGDNANALSITSVQSSLLGAGSNIVRSSQFTATSGRGTWASGTITSSASPLNATGYVLSLTGSVYESAPRGNDAEGFFPVTPNETYEGSWLRYTANLSGAGNVSMGMHFVDKNGTNTFLDFFLVPGGLAWGQNTGKVVVPAGAVKARPYIFYQGPSGVLLVNAMSIRALTGTAVQSASVTQALIANVGPGGAYAQATTMLDVNGHITGVS